MSLEQRLRDELKQALKAGDKTRLSTIRLMLTGIRNAEIARGASLDDSGILDVISKGAKQRRESIDAFRKGNRPDLVAREEAELAILLEYLPQQMSREEIIASARQTIAEMGAKGPGDRGKVMSKLMAQLKGKAEGKEVSAVVSELLAGFIQ